MAFDDVRILVVDDQEAMRRLHRFSLKQLKFDNVTEADSGATAMNYLLERPYTMVISDWNMSPMSGLELFKRMKADPNLRGIPFIMVTGNVGENDVKTAIGAGVRLYLGKPYTVNALKMRIEKALGRTLG